MDIYVELPWRRRSKKARALIRAVLAALEELGYRPKRVRKKICVQYCYRHERFECVCCPLSEPAVVFETLDGPAAYRLTRRRG
jgi:hypothetical protein